ncbi:hypothetical protein PHET_09879 [Paragonimus heterotremus]|uniref:CUB domain-containing protein n=1 Tax=Paragonimus heterotremus TaxID=100268 RepID=A0A8J4SSK4_9TREM|nr:hypothetical protein PHET_09879 [Paragonimus heterotremus]
MTILVFIFTFMWFVKPIVSAECGGDFNAIEGEVVSPDYTNQPDNPMLRCEWTIGYENAFGVKITVEYFQKPLQNIYFVSLMDRTNNETLDNFIEQPIDSSKIYATDKVKIYMLSFVSNRTGLRFKLKYVFLTCGGPIVQPKGELLSPNYTNLPGRNLVCEWQFLIPHASVIGINVLNFSAPTEGIQQLTVNYGEGKTSLTATGDRQFLTDNMTLKLQTDVSNFAGLRFRIQYDSMTAKEQRLSLCSASPSTAY